MGQKCIVKANHFFAELPDKDLHQYDVSFVFTDWTKLFACSRGHACMHGTNVILGAKRILPIPSQLLQDVNGKLCDIDTHKIEETHIPNSGHQE
jgi:hypothetical protein